MDGHDVSKHPGNHLYERKHLMMSTIEKKAVFARNLIATITLLSLLRFFFRILRDHSSGGDRWKQGDWLINSEFSPVRRSITGDIFIWIYDLTGINILISVLGAQLIIALALHLLAYKVICEDKTEALTLIALSSAFFLFFWTADPQGAARKEMITFVAILLTTIAINYNRSLLFLIGLSVFTFSVFSHEGMILFLPILLASYLLQSGAKQRRISMDFCILVASIVSIAAFYMSVKNSAVMDSSQICQALTSRGVSADICAGAITWLEYDLRDGIDAVQQSLSLSSVVQLLFGYIVALIPALYVALSSSNKRLSFALIFFSVLPFLPLYFFSVDFGRWISLHIFSIFILFASAIFSGRISFERPITNGALIGGCLLGSLLIHSHTAGIIWGGIFG